MLTENIWFTWSKPSNYFSLSTMLKCDCEVKVWCSPSVLSTTWSFWHVDSGFYLLVNWQSKSDDLWKRIQSWLKLHKWSAGIIRHIRFAHDIFMFDIKRGNLDGFTQMMQLLWRVLAALTSPIIKIILCCLSDLPFVSKNDQQIHSAKNTIVRKNWIVIIEIFCNQWKIGHDM